MASFRAFLLLALFVVSLSAQALEEKSFCIYDPVGKNGPAMTFWADLIPKAISWNLDLKLNAYTDEKVASNDFKAGVCDAVFLTAILSRQYVPFGGTLDAAGGIVNETGLNSVLKALTNPKMSSLLTHGNYEVVGTFPVGAVYLFMKHRDIDSVGKFSGKKISILNEDPQAYKLASLAGASPVGTSLATFSGQFNNGNIDILPMVALGYNLFELYRGLGEQGGIIDHKLYYGLMQMISVKDHFSPDFGQQMREYILSRLSDIHKLVEEAEKEIPAKYWIQADAKTKTELEGFTKQIRLALRDEGVNDPRALKLLWKIRCTEDPSRAECDTAE